MTVTIVKTGVRDREYHQVNKNDIEIGYILLKTNGRFSAFMGKSGWGNGNYIGQYDTLMEAKDAIDKMSEVMA